ncbi:MAG: DJ-1/PfpI family protein [Bacteroidaceae bacterium]|jgi:4-methyl-5(b-hydroxyethyl)-thiazole monophosphate biosynthesis|nr:DJ-1/PfpI family protein [Bacteroidaceae bacterium]
MKKAIVFLAEGFEEVEALTVVDVLRRGGVEVTTMSITEDPYVDGAHGIEVLADADNEYEIDDADMIVLPGGMPGASNLRASAVVCDGVLSFVKAGKLVGAICAAPFVLGELGVLNGKKATCYPGFEDKLQGAAYTATRVQRDGNIITGNGPSSALPFALALLAAITDDDTAQQVADGMLV